ncbi:ribokinase [Parendozoicomonas haliclonae]|nr:ribokinase [Parendozoicomonas haliclonae]
MKNILVLGSVNADHVLRLEHFPRPGETLTGSSYNVIPGGKGANQAVACARLGGQTRFMACVGEDGIGHEMVKGFAADGIDIDAVSLVSGVNTGVALIFVDNKAENCIGIAAEANNCLDEAFVQTHKDAIIESDYLLMQLETPESGIQAAATIARESGTTVVLNPAPARALSDTLLSCVDIITPNQTEAEVLTGIAVHDFDSASQAADLLHGKGIQTVLITMGSSGAFLSQKIEATVQRELISGFKVQPVDTTAAGDTFNGGFLVALSEGLSANEAIRFANACGALSVMKHGAQTSIPLRSDVDAFLSER